MRRMLLSLIFLPLLSALFHGHPLTACGRATPMFATSHTFQRSSPSVSRLETSRPQTRLKQTSKRNVQEKIRDKMTLLAWNCHWCFPVSKVVAKQDHKTGFLLVALGHRTRPRQKGENPSFTGQIKVRIELISLLCLKAKTSQIFTQSLSVGLLQASHLLLYLLFLHL